MFHSAQVPFSVAGQVLSLGGVRLTSRMCIPDPFETLYYVVKCKPFATLRRHDHIFQLTLIPFPERFITA